MAKKAKQTQTSGLDDIVTALAPVIKNKKAAIALAVAGYFMEVPDNVQKAMLGYLGGEALQGLLEEVRNAEKDF